MLETSRKRQATGNTNRSGQCLLLINRKPEPGIASLLFTIPGFRLLSFLSLAILVCASLSRAFAEECATCHDVGEKVSKSAHSVVTCAKCHPKHETYPHAAGTPKPVCSTCHASQFEGHAASVHGRELKKGNTSAPNCNACHGEAHEVTAARTAEFKKSVPETCGMCHSDVLTDFNSSIHGQAVAKNIVNAPVCTDCHGEHSILSPKEESSSVNVRHVRETCARCHGNLALARQFGMPADRITTFDASFHGLAEKGGVQTVASCASCHGFHTILPSSNSKSMTHQKNLAQTCGKCHPGAGQRFALGPIHITEDSKQESPLVRYARLFYLVLIPGTLCFMLLHHGGDFVRKVAQLRLNGRAINIVPSAEGSFRMHRVERIQHALLAVSFLVLVWSGFALKYTNQWWAVGGSMRGVVHRVAAVVMIAVSIAHLVVLIVNKRARDHWKALIPGKRDIVEVFQRTMYNIGLRKERPKISAHSYVEKVEYWAVVWGTFVMALTGILLWANNWALANLPKVVLDLANAIHFYEAILAAAAILIWHFYSVIFDPEVYPMDPAWMTGRSPRHHDHDHHHDPHASGKHERARSRDGESNKPKPETDTKS